MCPLATHFFLNFIGASVLANSHMNFSEIEVFAGVGMVDYTMMLWNCVYLVYMLTTNNAHKCAAFFCLQSDLAVPTFNLTYLNSDD